MQDYGGRYKNELTIQPRSGPSPELKENEAAAAYAANPHELGRTLECFSLITLGEMTMHASSARRCSSAYLDFYRLDYPELDPPSGRNTCPCGWRRTTSR